jgi:hypothetical protein
MPVIYRYVPTVEPNQLGDLRFDVVSGNMGTNVEVAYGDCGRALAGIGSPYKRLRERGITTYLRLQRPPTYRAGVFHVGQFIATMRGDCDFFALLDRVDNDQQAHDLARTWVGIVEIDKRGGIYCIADIGDDDSIPLTKTDVRLVVPWREVVLDYRLRIKSESPESRAEARKRSSAQLLHDFP